MSIFSKIFGSNKIELTDDSNDEAQDNQSEKATIENKEPSPFLSDDEKDIKSE